MANEPKWPSFEWRNQVRNDPEVTHFQWRVADALAERVDRRTGYAQFYQREIVDELGCSMRGAHGALHQLVKRLHLQIQNLGRADGKLRYIPVVNVTLVGAAHRRAYPYASACVPDTHGDSDGVCTVVRTKEPPRETPEKPPSRIYVDNEGFRGRVLAILPEARFKRHRSKGLRAGPQIERRDGRRDSSSARCATPGSGSARIRISRNIPRPG